MRDLFTKVVSTAKKILIGLMLISVLLILLMRWIDPIGSMIMLERKLTNWSLHQQRTWKDWDDISDNIKIAVIASEDQRFSTHFGFDLKAINIALNHNKNSKKVRGASTISQQVAKNIFLWSSRSWLRKGIESWFTLWIEVLWSKQRILEIYLNSAEWGEGIFGIEAASRHYFNVSAKQLTVQQASLLAAILPNPRKWSPTSPSSYVQKKAAWIRTQINNLGGKSYLQQLE